MHYNSVMRIDFGIRVYEKNELGRWDMKIKKVCRMLGVTLLAASLMAVPVSAAPSVDELQKEKAAAQSQVSSLQQELTGILVKLDELETELVEKGQEVTQVTSDLEAAKEKEAKQYEDMKLRIQYMYEDGDATFVSKLLESNSIADILNQAEYVSKVHSYDRKALEEYVKTTQQVAELKTTLETEISNLENMQTTYSEEKDNLNSTIETKKEVILTSRFRRQRQQLQLQDRRNWKNRQDVPQRQLKIREIPDRHKAESASQAILQQITDRQHRAARQEMLPQRIPQERRIRTRQLSQRHLSIIQ